MSEAHDGLRQAIQAVFNGASWQRCYVHFIRNALSHVSKSAQWLVAALLRNVFQQTSSAAQSALRQAVSTLEDGYAKVARLLEDAKDDGLAGRPSPSPSRPRHRSEGTFIPTLPMSPAGFGGSGLAGLILMNQSLPVGRRTIPDVCTQRGGAA
ncbi:MAG: transposase [Myxococcota bacterium]